MVRFMALILTVNAGSSSVRLGLFAVVDGALHLESMVRHDGHPADPAALLDGFLGTRRESVVAVAHRVVHGGPELNRTSLVDDAVTRAITDASEFAPLHNPVTLQWMHAASVCLPDALAVAAFDAALFAELPPAAASYALPEDLVQKHHLRRAGFHGLAHQSMYAALVRAGGPRGRVITLQLGAGCSATALREGVAIDTSMGLTPLEGLVMATRSGDVDPGIVLLLMKREGLDPDQMDQLLSRRSGLLGLAGTSRMDELLARKEEQAVRAVDLFCYRIRKCVGAYLAVLGGCDAIAFGGGMGEHQPVLRARVLAGLQDLGISVDEDANFSARPPSRISPASSPVQVWVVPTDEETALATAALPYVGV